MFRRFRHKLLILLQAGIVVSGAVALALRPSAWPAVLVCVLGSTLAAHVCGRITRRYLNATLGRLRRVADDVGHGHPVATLDVQPGHDLYKLNAAINLLAARLAEAAEKERRLQDELRRRERLAFLGELAATVAHEVNNPLDGVQNCARILRRSLSDRQRSGQMLDLIDSGLARIELIVRRLLTLARQHVVRPTPTRIADVLSGAIEAVRPKIDGRGIQVLRRFETDEGALVDRPLLEQVFVNLMLNAADSMPAGGELTIAVRREPVRPDRSPPHETAEPAGGRGVAGAGSGGDGPEPASAGAHGAGRTADAGGGPDGGHILCIDVVDTGTGISPDVLPHIFEPFFTTKSDGKGTGLGLAIASRIVDAHRGTLSVAPRAGGGTIFTVRLPALSGGIDPLVAATGEPKLTAAPVN